MTNCDPLADAIASTQSQPNTSWRALDALAQRTVGAKLFTAMTFDARTGLASRVYTNDPDSYPVAGTKPIEPNAWTAQVIDQGQTFVANDIAAIANVFSDHELIQSLGCESVVNVPVFANGEMLGSINLLHEAGYYTPARVADAQTLTLSACACFLFARLLAHTATIDSIGDSQ